MTHPIGRALHPGEFFGSGTVGNGCGLEQLRFLKAGDIVELEVEGIGTLKEPRSAWLKARNCAVK